MHGMLMQVTCFSEELIKSTSPKPLPLSLDSLILLFALKAMSWHRPQQKIHLPARFSQIGAESQFCAT